MKNESKLLNCPFCGGEAEICDGYIEEFLKTEYMKYVQCNYCKASTKLYFTEKEAIKAWNTRVPMERIMERLESESRFYNSASDSDQYIRNGIKKAIEILKEEGGIE
jgi:Lar family restriction alleviation protein